jgi:hypothetical protein
MCNLKQPEFESQITHSFMKCECLEKWNDCEHEKDDWNRDKYCDNHAFVLKKGLRGLWFLFANTCGQRVDAASPQNNTHGNAIWLNIPTPRVNALISSVLLLTAITIRQINSDTHAFPNTTVTAIQASPIYSQHPTTLLNHLSYYPSRIKLFLQYSLSEVSNFPSSFSISSINTYLYLNLISLKQSNNLSTFSKK